MKMTRALLFIVVAILCASCRTDAQLDPIQATAIIDAAEVTDREECLYQEELLASNFTFAGNDERAKPCAQQRKRHWLGNF